MQNGGDIFDINTQNPVRVYQCRGGDLTTPSGPWDCYGAPGFFGIPALNGQPEIPANPGFTYLGQTDDNAHLPDGAANFQDTVTAADGTGSVTIQLFTTREAPSLGCDDTTPCSIVVVPNYGRQVGATENLVGATEDLMDAPWAWANRTVVPLRFAPLEASCALGTTGVMVVGSPMSDRALASWRAGSCTRAENPVTVNYTMIGEPQTRQDLIDGAADVGLVNRPVPGDSPGADGVGYAPVNISGLTVAFQIDDSRGKIIPYINLNQRLVAKLITASYRVASSTGVVGNPKSLFKDPEFLALNPDFVFPSGAPGNHPLLVAEYTDMTYVLTQWIDADPAARAFLDGTPDEWGMHVNTFYEGMDLPIESFPLLDEAQVNSFAPIQGLDHVSQKLSIAQFPGAVVSEENGITIVSKPPRQNPGRREVFGIIDTGNAATFRLATARLRNTAGEFVAPTDESLLAAVAHMAIEDDGVVGPLDLTATDPAIYPLTMVTTAMFPSAATGEQATAIGNFLDYAAGDGQISGSGQGELPAGYVSLPADLVKVTRAASERMLLAGQPSQSATATATPSATQTKKPSDSASASPTATEPAGYTEPGTGDSSSGGVIPTDASVPAPVEPSASPSPSALPSKSGLRTVSLAAVNESVPLSRLVPLLLALGPLTGVTGAGVLLFVRRNQSSRVAR